jgi:hypothetical protein
VAPSGGLVVAGAGLEAARVAGESLSAAKAWITSAAMSRSLRTYRAATIFFLPEARVTGEVPAYFLRALADAYRAGSSPNSPSTRAPVIVPRGPHGSGECGGQRRRPARPW